MSANGDIHVERGGAGDDLLVLLHGMGANAEVWRPMLAAAEKRWPGRWIAPDLRGHGRSTKQGPFGLRMIAGDVAALIAQETARRPAPRVVALGHSFGGLVAAFAASDEIDARVDEVVAISVKLDWSEEEVSRLYGLAERPLKDFATFEEAADRALAFAGLKGLAALTSSVAVAGVEEADGRFRPALAPGVFGAVGADVAAVMRLSRAPLRMASGETDAMAPVEPMRALDPEAAALAGAGHNAHWETPDAVWRLVAGEA